MSLKSWLDEFYPVPASKVSKEDALEHSIQKWKGLLPDNLKKHNVAYRGEEILSCDITDIVQSFMFTASSCALCKHWYDGDSGCPECPLVKAGHICCEEFGSAWRDRYNNPARMIAELENSRESL